MKRIRVYIYIYKYMLYNYNEQIANFIAHLQSHSSIKNRNVDVAYRTQSYDK